MTVVTTPNQQRRISKAARKVGGYGELARLANEYRTVIALNGNPILIQILDKWHIVNADVSS